MSIADAVSPDQGPSPSAGYRPPAGTYDEMIARDGDLRSHWHGPMQALDALGGVELARRQERIRGLLQDNGVTYNVYDDPRNSQRPWAVDPIPLVMDGQEWHGLEEGLAQRARLWEALVADLYGRRSVLLRGLLPPELVLADPRFLRPCHGFDPPGGRWLHLYGADLARGPDGRFLVLRDRVQSLAGVGYALENRILLARALPNLYRDAPLRRLASFLEAERQALARLAFRNREQPRMVLLTPGPRNESYFEHAYLANYLSLTLVEGEDLVARDGRIWLKTLGGLQQVDVILRRVGDVWCDPLELRADSLLGVPGLLQAARGGGVAVANALGVGLVENAALMAYLPALCRHLLGEELRLPSVATWWCGGAVERAHVLDRLGELLIWETDGPRSQEPWVGSHLVADARAALARRIEATPERFVAQEPVVPSTAPFLEGEALVPRPVVMRGFAVAQDDDFRVMPGGLARVSVGSDHARLSVQRGGVSKDLWVTAPVPERHVSLLRQGMGPGVVTRDGDDLPSRVADNLYWMGRYGERLDGHLRLLREAMGRFLERIQGGGNGEDCLEDLLTVLELPSAEASTAGERLMELRGILLGMFTEEGRVGSLPHTFSGVLRTGRAVRDHLGDDSWRVLNGLHLRMRSLPPRLTTSRALELINGNLTQLTALFGLINDTMPHHHGWRFLDVGRQLERVQSTLALLELAFVTAVHPGVSLWEVVLSTTDNLTAYRRRYRSELHPTAILDLLLFDEGNPRSVGYQLLRLQTQIAQLPKSGGTPYRGREERLIQTAVCALQLADIATLASLHREEGAGQALAELLASLQGPMEELSEALVHTHFSHAEVPRQLVSIWP